MYRWSTVILSSGNDEYKLLIKRKALKMTLWLRSFPQQEENDSMYRVERTFDYDGKTLSPHPTAIDQELKVSR